MKDYRITAQERFGKLITLTDGKKARDKILCQCDCGSAPKLVLASSLLGTAPNYTRSCGCANAKRLASGMRRTHGLSKHPLYVTWKDMRKRCNNKNHKQYADYGGRGIVVCERWDDFTTFLADMGERPSGMSLERKDNDGPYSNRNCVWADAVTQRANQRPGTGNTYVAEMQMEIALLQTDNEHLRKRVNELENLFDPPHAVRPFVI